MNKLLLTLLLTLLLLLAAYPAAAAPASFNVVVTGAGRPMILIPGLSSPGMVWESTIKHYSERYEVHCLTLAGFAGVAPVEGAFLPRVRRDVIEYIKAQKLSRPVIIGHSLGGFLAYWIAATEPDLVGATVAVDGLPALGAVMNPSVTTQQLSDQGDALHKILSSQTPAEFAAQTRSSLAGMITSKDDLDRVAAEAVKSDPATVARAVKEMISTDLRKELENIRTPVLLIAASGGMPEEYASGIRERYEAQVAAAPDHRVVVASNARHFIMLDDPQFFFSTVDAFLSNGATDAKRRVMEKER